MSIACSGQLEHMKNISETNAVAVRYASQYKRVNCCKTRQRWQFYHTSTILTRISKK